ncbi:MAG TPA: glycoside hydrolase family 43 protein [Clostridia bacterium]|nr:glycoside hydrolase family 43 protein [Clostridia bacterium]
MILTKDIPIRDPFIVVDYQNFRYALFGTTDVEHTWDGKSNGFDVYIGTDLEHWEEPLPAFRPEADFWADRNFWAAEVHYWKSNWYMFATFKADGIARGTQILKSVGGVTGPYKPITGGPVTPPEWECLDGTFYVDRAAKPWMVFCHEWTQAVDGAIYAIPLADDLSKATGGPIRMFSASESGWAKKHMAMNRENYITDGPFMFRNRKGDLFMLWSSVSDTGYAVAQSRSLTGELKGPWKHYPPIYSADGGHGMIFPALDGRLMLAIHSPNSASERPVFLELIEKDGILALK